MGRLIRVPIDTANDSWDRLRLQSSRPLWVIPPVGAGSWYCSLLDTEVEIKYCFVPINPVWLVWYKR